MTFRLRLLATANSLPVPTAPLPPICSSHRSRMNGSLWNKWSLSVWHLQMNHSCKKPNPPICFISCGGEFPALVLTSGSQMHKQPLWLKTCKNVVHMVVHCSYRGQQRIDITCLSSWHLFYGWDISSKNERQVRKLPDSVVHLEQSRATKYTWKSDMQYLSSLVIHLEF